MEQRWESNTHVAPNCPRCASSNTKFCYYNNYSLSQPRYFCKGCRRYWTKGGSLRNVPVGGGCRRTRRTKQARSTSQTNRVGPTPGRSSTDPENSGSSDIDMAAVFANFLNQSSNLENKGNSCDLINETGMPRVENGFSGHDPNVFELGTLLSDELPNFGWQPMVHLDEFGSFLAVDQSNSSTDLISDNWSSLDVDILGYENLI